MTVDAVDVYIVGGRRDGMTFSARKQESLAPVREFAGRTHYLAFEVDDLGSPRAVYVLDTIARGALGTKPRRRRLAPSYALPWLKLPYVHFLEGGCTHAQAAELVGTTYIAMLRERKWDANFAAACKVAKQRARS